MKVSGKRRRSSISRVVRICVGLIVFTGLFLAGSWVYQQVRINGFEQEAREAAQATDKVVAVIEAKKNQPVYIVLPGADKIQAPVENYEGPSSIWALVNKDHALPIDYVPAPLVMPELAVRSNSTSDEKHVRQTIVEPLTKMYEAAEAQGHSLMIGSAYRSAATQATLFNSYVASAGYAEANMYSAHAGHSEHQTGLAVDISTTSQQCYLSACFIGTADGQWLAENAYKYGFTLRYPDGKEAITGYNFEPWHYRYVGVALATSLHQSGLTLDEAWPYLKTALATLRDNRALPKAI